MSLKDDWKQAGKGIGRSFMGLGKAIARSVEEGAQRMREEPNADGTPRQPNDLRKSWSAVGHGFGDAGKSLGKAVAGTAQTVAESVDEEFSRPASQEPPADPPEEK